MPLLVVVACVLLGWFVALTSGHTYRISHGCRWVPLPGTVWATCYGGLAAALAAVVLRGVLRRCARARGWDPGATRPGGLADGAAVLGGLAALLLAGAVVLTHVESALRSPAWGPLPRSHTPQTAAPARSAFLGCRRRFLSSRPRPSRG